MFNLSTSELEKYIQDDLPYFDLTTSLQNCNNAIAQIEVYTREDIIVSCSEEASKIAELLNCKVDFFVKSKKPRNAFFSTSRQCIYSINS